MPSYLPEEIILNILLRLQVKTLLRFRCVCKSWCNLITSHDFVKMHLNQALDHEKNNCSLLLNSCQDFYSIDSVSSSELCSEIVKFDSPFKSRLSIMINVLASCNGLLCIVKDYGDSFFIWNPSTKVYKEISSPTPITRDGSHYDIAYGFGYDCKIDDYKLVKIFNMEVNVYTLGSSSWRNLQSVLHNPLLPRQQDGVFLNGALHWIDNICDSRTNESEVLVSFDIGDERFQEIELPKKCLVGESYLHVGVLSGDLCLLDHTSNVSTDVWVMKDYGVVESWTKLFSIAQETTTTSVINYLKPVQSFKNGEILFWVGLNGENFYEDALVSYDPKPKRVRTLKIKGIPKMFNGVETYVGSLVSPNRVLL